MSIVGPMMLKICDRSHALYRVVKLKILVMGMCLDTAGLLLGNMAAGCLSYRSKCDDFPCM